MIEARPTLERPLSLLAADAVANRQLQRTVELGRLTPEGAAVINEVLANARRPLGKRGLDVTGSKLFVRADELRKNWVKHVGTNETDPRNEPLAPSDFDLIPDIVARPDRVAVSRAGSPAKTPTVEFQKEVEGYLVAAEAHAARGELRVLSVFRRKLPPRGGSWPSGPGPVRPTEPATGGNARPGTPPEAVDSISARDLGFQWEEARYLPWDDSPGRPEPDLDAEVRAAFDEPEESVDPATGEFPELPLYEDERMRVHLARGLIAPEDAALVARASAELERMADIDRAYAQAVSCVLWGGEA